MPEKPPILNVKDVELHEMRNPVPPNLAGKYAGARIGRISAALGAEKLGYNVTVVPPGRRAFAYHAHRVNEEMFFILEGEGQIRIGSDRFPVKKGDVIACPPGGPDTAHQIINTGPTELRYLAVSTTLSPEVAAYPDSDKFAVFAEFPGSGNQKQTFRFLGRAASTLGYYDGEPEDEK